MVKGKSKPVLAVAVGEQPGARHDERVALPLVGRAHEMAVLTGTLDDVRAGRGRVVDISGEAGIGKSRLAAEMLAGAEDIPIVTAPCEQYESSTPFFPFRRLLSDALGVSGGGTTEEAADRIFETASPPPRRTCCRSCRSSASRWTSRWRPRARSRRSRTSSARHGSRRSSPSCWAVLLDAPTVLVVEDVHAMDESSADLLQRSGRRGREERRGSSW